MNVAENVAFGLKVRKEERGSRDARVEGLLELVQMTHFAPLPGSAVGRAATAGRARAGSGAASTGCCCWTSRSARWTRRSAGPPSMARRAAPRARRHEPAGHPRPGRGARARQPGRGDARRTGRAGGRAGRRLQRSCDGVRRRIRRRGQRLARSRGRRPGTPRDVPGARRGSSRGGRGSRGLRPPHDVRVSKEETGVRGTIERMATLGWLARLSIKLPGGETLVAHVPHDELGGAKEATRSGWITEPQGLRHRDRLRRAAVR